MDEGWEHAACAGMHLVTTAGLSGTHGAAFPRVIAKIHAWLTKTVRLKGLRSTGRNQFLESSKGSKAPVCGTTVSFSRASGAEADVIEAPKKIGVALAGTLCTQTVQAR